MIQILNDLKSNKYKVLFLFILSFYSLVLSQFGLENFDTGYIPSFSWRIVNGQSVYQDFIYKGPPVTLYFNAFFMYLLPESGQFFWIRMVNYLLFASQVYLLVSAFDKIYSLRKYRIEKWGIIAVGFLVSLLNFSPYPWPTTDGLLFAAIAFWLVSRTETPNFSRLFLIALCCVLSALTKQSFYLVPLFFLFWILLKFNVRAAFLFLVLIIFCVIVYLSLVSNITSFDNFIAQTTGETHLHDLFSTGIHNYIFIPITWFVMALLSLALFIWIYLKFKVQSIDITLPFFKWTAIVIFCLAIVFSLFKEIHIASRIGFVAVVIALFYRFEFRRENILYLTPIAVTLGIAWSCSISLGYQFPIFFATGIILSFLILVGEDLKKYSKYYLWIALPICIGAFSYNYRPYREATIPNLKYALDSISPKLKYIKTNKSNFEKYSELKKIIEKYGENFIVAPNIPMANYLFNHHSELPADWLIETEVARRQKMFIRLASERKNYVFLEKSFLEREECMPENKEKFSSIAAFIYNNFDLIEETNYFLIYNSIKRNETLP